MKRRNTIDSSNSSSSSILKYYYTYNTGTCDDFLLLFQEDSSSKINSLNRSNTFPMHSRDKQKHSNLPENSTTTTEITRRWSTTLQASSSKNKRNTLANLISTLTDKSSPVLPENTTDQENNKKSFDKTWESIRSYKGKERANEEEPAETAVLKATPVTTILPETKATTAAVTVVKPPEKKKVTIATTTNPQLDLPAKVLESNNKTRANNALRNSSIIYPSSSSSSTSRPDSTSITMDLVPILDHFPEKQRIPANEKAIYFFLFGFLIFPLWWIGAWQYMREKKNYNDRTVPKNREIFPILNFLMSLVSLLLIGLVIGLSTVWAK
ncbi:hypothetical protein BD770DRAFT_439589 [Pilaira anomala]|nr:hypothetical protein BD770DRAFT_439589 [Pilaira anomala]